MARVDVIFENSYVGKDVLALNPGKNLITGESTFRKSLGQPSSLETDLLTVASAIYASDLAVKRSERERVTRKIELNVPVVNLAVFNEIRYDLQYALYILSHDAWTINFSQKPGEIESQFAKTSSNDGKVLLFSGGLDAFSAAIDFGEAGQIVQLVSHTTANPIVSGSQNTLYSYLDEAFPNQFQHLAFRVSGRNRPSEDLYFPSGQEREDSQRTRSFLFLSLAGLVARRKGLSEIVYIAENGQMAIHLPLTAARISAFSTYTAHPEFTKVMGNILSTLLKYSIRIQNPFLYRTKGEVVSNAIKNHRTAAESTVSCWRASRVGGHCGACIPCYIRRIAVESNGVRIAEYERDLFNERISELPPDDEGKRNLIDLVEFAKIFNNANTQASLEGLYPELINEHIKGEQAVAMYRRFAVEANKVFLNYPGVREIMV